MATANELTTFVRAAPYPPVEASSSPAEPGIPARKLWARRHPADFDVRELGRILDHDNHQMRAELRAFLADPLFVPRYDISLKDERELALRRLRKLRCMELARWCALASVSAAITVTPAIT